MIQLNDGRAVYACTCQRCGYAWVTRPSTPEPPKKCPKCENYGWNKKPKYRWKKTVLKNVAKMLSHEAPKSEELH